MQLIEVNNKETIRQFLDFPKRLYKNDKNWTCILDAEIEGIFDKNKNSEFKNGDACRWILVDANKNVLGRIGAFYNKDKANKPVHGQPTGGVGFFDCVNDQDVANKLFDVAKDWLSSKGMEAMDGPINFGENYVHWGLLIDGFMHQGYGMQYNFPYYKELFENYGFQNYFEQYSYHIDLTKPFPERQEKFARHVMQKPNYTWDHLRFNNYKKYINDLVEVYNSIWSEFHEDYNPLTFEDFEKVFLEAKPLLNEELVVFAYDKGKPIGLIISFPDLNQVFKKLKNGKLHLINKLKLLYHKKHSITRARQLVSGVLPKYQRTGIISPLFLKMADACKKHGITEIEMGWIGDYNTKVINLYKQMGPAYKAKTHVTYRYLFDREKPFKRFTNMHTHKDLQE